MEKLDIFKNKLAIAEHVDTRKGLLTRREIPHCAPRKCDGLIFILAGSCRYSFDDGMKFEAKKDDMLYLAKDAIYDMDVNCDRYEFFVLDFNFLCAETRKSAVYPIQSPAYIHQLFTKLCAKNGANIPNYRADRRQCRPHVHARSGARTHRPKCRPNTPQFFRQGTFGLGIGKERGLQRGILPQAVQAPFRTGSVEIHSPNANITRDQAYGIRRTFACRNIRGMRLRFSSLF